MPTRQTSKQFLSSENRYSDLNHGYNKLQSDLNKGWVLVQNLKNLSSGENAIRLPRPYSDHLHHVDVSFQTNMSLHGSCNRLQSL